METNSDTFKSIKDLSDYFTNKIAELLEEVHMAKMKLSLYPESIFVITANLDQIFIMVRTKLEKRKLHNLIKVQEKYATAINKLRPIKVDRRMDKENDQLYNKYIRTKEFAYCRYLTERREAHTYHCLDTIDYLAREIKKQRRIT